MHHYESPETYFMAVNYLDRISTDIALNISTYRTLSLTTELVGATCFLIAAKTCEINPPRIGKLVELSCGAFSCGALEVAELKLLKALDWRLNAPTSILFLYIYHDIVLHAGILDERRLFLKAVAILAEAQHGTHVII